MRIDKERAQRLLRYCEATGDFHALPQLSVDLLLQEADAYGYRAPRNANGSRARCWHAYLTRQAG